MLNVEIEIGEIGEKHVGEVQLHFAGIIALKEECHIYYEFFRAFFAGTDESYRKRLEMFEKLMYIEEGLDIASSIREMLEEED